MCDGTCPIRRRDFIAQSTLAAVAALLASACGDGEIGGPAPVAPRLSESLTIRLEDFPALATVGGIARVDGGRGPATAVTRMGAESFAAFSMICPHAAATLGITADGFVCPNHGARFSPAGVWVGGQPASNLFAFLVSYDATAGTLTISSRLPGNVELTVKLADFPALAVVGGIARVDKGEGPPVGVARTGATAYAAYGLACPHQQYVVEPHGGEWRCPAHDSRFAASGDVTRGPAATALVALAVYVDTRAGTLEISGTAPAGKSLEDDG